MNTYGRQVVVPLTNKSGAGVVAGDVVIVDTTNNDAFTTTTAANFTGGVGIAQETIANNAVGRVLLSGYAALVNVNASVTRGHFGATFTVAKQATDAGATRGAGTFCQFLTAGATPDALVYPVDLLGSSLTNPMSAVGDIIQGTTAGAPAALAAPVAGKVLTGAGTTTPLVYAFPPGHEWDRAQITSPATISTHTASPGDALIASNSVTYDGTAVDIEVGAASMTPATNAGYTVLHLWIDSTEIGDIFVTNQTNATIPCAPVRVRYTPSAGAHTFTVRGHTSGSASATLDAGNGGADTRLPAYIRITKA